MSKSKLKDVQSKLVAIRLSNELYDALKDLAARDRRTFSAYVRLVLFDHSLVAAEAACKFGTGK